MGSLSNAPPMDYKVERKFIDFFRNNQFYEYQSTRVSL